MTNMSSITASPLCWPRNFHKPKNAATALPADPPACHVCFVIYPMFAWDPRALVLQQGGNGSACSITLDIPKAMKAPIFIYYEMDNFFQNHRR